MSGQFDALGPDGNSSLLGWILAQVAIGTIDWILSGAGADAGTIIAVTIGGEAIVTYVCLN